MEREQRDQQHETENTVAVVDAHDKIIEEDSGPNILHHPRCSEINTQNCEATTKQDTINECPPPESLTSTLTENDIEREKPRLLDLSTSGEESDIEDDINNKGKSR